MRCWYYITDSRDPYRNLALEECLLHNLREDEVLLYLWQNEDTIVIGRNQNAWRECMVREFEAEGGRLARRLSGGGAVYHDLGNQNFTFLAKQPLYDVAKQTEVIRLAAKSFGIEAQRSGRNDVLAAGRKFSGNAFYKTGDNCYHHGTILINSDMQRLGRFLHPSREKLEEKGVSSVRSRVVNLAELCPAVTPQAMRAALLEAMAEVYGVTPAPLDGRRASSRRVKVLGLHYASKQWRLGRRITFTDTMEKRLSFGEVEILLSLKAGRVERAQVFTDAMDPSWSGPLALALTGCEYHPEALAGRVYELPGLEDGMRNELQHFVRQSALQSAQL